ncbi:conserved exported hypothetical protein [Roseovarius sp. EC-HK134]|jgi:hypothetical protein|nr:conserved exported hypothetical protein [Roseovarius sp. EC-HK134]VVT02196.1 conserved exported hypothetical protein [Roseovarius sp. EC-SD190]|tara:strand:- start:506 stop:904 length:399 start_codon:yes stop_codon:yes gene_type:complete
MRIALTISRLRQMMLGIICVLALATVPPSALHAQMGGHGEPIGTEHTTETMSDLSGIGHDHSIATHCDESGGVANADDEHGGIQCCSGLCFSGVLDASDVIRSRDEPNARYAAIDRLIVSFDPDSPQRPPRV